MTLSLGSSARAYRSACGSSSSNGRSPGNGPAERRAEVPRLHRGQVLDQAEQVRAGRGHRPAQVVLREAVELVQHLLVQEAETVDEGGLRVRDRHAGIVEGTSPQTAAASALVVAALAAAVAGMVVLGSRREPALALVPVRAHLSSDEAHVLLRGRGTDPV